MSRRVSRSSPNPTGQLRKYLQRAILTPHRKQLFVENALFPSVLGFSFANCAYTQNASKAGPSGKLVKLSAAAAHYLRSEEHTSELQSRFDLVCRLLLEKKKTQ